MDVIKIESLTSGCCCMGDFAVKKTVNLIRSFSWFIYYLLCGSPFLDVARKGIIMYIIAGLGNPGKQYEMTRHNIGFHTIDYIADRLKVKVKKLKYKSLYGETEINGEKVYLVKPQTYMNLSGESIAEFAEFYKLSPEKIIIINDDISLDVGRIRVRPKGSAGGHNGLKSIIYRLGSDEFPRIKMGVGAPPNKDYDLADFVLGRFTREEIPIMEKAIIKAADAAEEIIKNGVPSAMNKYNSK